MKRFEHHSVLWPAMEPLDSIIQKMNTLGNEGWGLVWISPAALNPETNDHVVRLWFKREVE